MLYGESNQSPTNTKFLEMFLGINVFAPIQTSMDFIPETLEWKKVYDFSTSVIPTPTGSVFILNSIATGTDYNERVGRVINLEAIRLRFTSNPPIGFDMIDQRLRVLLVLDKQSNSAVSTLPADILQTVATLSSENFANRLRIVILKDWLYQLSRLTVANGLITDSTFVCEDIYLRLNIPAIYGGTSGIVAPESGAIYLVVIAGGASLNPSFSFSSRIYFSDP